ncbi:hypothetical protein [Maricaulis alexandrii]|uniref:hypothetical protein n=1 Tax=Maricaulis alexandrii TaxID=2570354 RepID=UPI00110842B0|nr:hypothetical protein [Maricaulis alexandrii]
MIASRLANGPNTKRATYWLKTHSRPYQQPILWFETENRQYLVVIKDEVPFALILSEYDVKPSSRMELTMANAEAIPGDEVTYGGASLGNAPYRYKFFLAAPMSSLNKDEYASTRDWAMRLTWELERVHGGNSVYYAGRNITTSNEFTPADEAAKTDVDAVLNARHFLLFYPIASHTSAHFELGLAAGLGRDVTIITPSRDTLPFLLQHPEALAKTGLSKPIRVIEYGDHLPVAGDIALTL